MPLPRIPANPLSRSTTYAASGFGVWQGLGLLLSDPQRLSSPSLRMVLEYQTAWAVAALAAGLLVFVGITWNRWWVKAVGLGVLFVWCLGFATATLHAFLINPTAGPTGPPAYYFAAAAVFILIWVDGKVRHEATTAPPTSA